MSEICLKGASGLGDTIIAYPIIKHYSKLYDTVHYMTDYPELYKSIGNVKCYPHQKINYIQDGDKKIGVDIRFTYCGRKYTPGSSQFEDSCISAGIKEKLDFNIDWPSKNEQYEKQRPICILAAPYEPFGREDEWGAILRINPKIMHAIVDEYKDRVDFIQIGNRFVLHKINGVTYDMVNKTNVTELMDLVKMADVGLSQVGNLLPMCEALGVKTFTIFSEEALKCDNRFISSITPEKVVHYKDMNISVKDTEIKKAVESFGKLINII
jgi:hypothetical protein